MAAPATLSNDVFLDTRCLFFDVFFFIDLMVEFAFGVPAMSLFGERLFIVTYLVFVLVFFLHLDFLDAIGSSLLVESANPRILIKQSMFLPRVVMGMGEGMFCGSFKI